MKDNPKILFFGAGAIGGTVGSWIAEKYENIFFLDKGEIANTLKTKGITTYCEDTPGNKVNVKVNVVTDLSQIPDADVIVVGVKNYSLDEVSKIIKAKYGDAPIIIAMQNGIENQKILPKYFSKVIYCVIGYNAWIDEPGIIGYQKKGPLVFGTIKNELTSEMNQLAKIFNLGVETIVVDHIQDAAHSKLIINLTNSLTTLIGHKFKEISDPALFQKLLTNLLLEGVNIARAAGYHECKIGGMPPWIKIWMGARLPRFITKGMFESNAKKMVLSSMAQDILQRKGHQSELDTINGYFIELADKYKINAPFNKVIYDLCKKEFAKPTFVPLDVKDVWAKVQEKL